MKKSYVLYVHDHKFIFSNNGYYSEGKFTNEVFARYDVFNADINVISRVLGNCQPDNLNKITNSNVNFKPVTGVDFYSIFTKNLYSNVKLVISEIIKSNVLIIRLPSFLGIFILILNIFFRKKYFIELVGDAQEALITSRSQAGFLFKIFAYMFSMLNRFFVKKSDGVIYVTQYDLQKKYPSRKFQSYASNVEVNVNYLELNIDLYCFKNNEIKIGMIGSFNNEYKGIDIALKAIKILKEKGCFINFHILGSGALKEHYLDMAKQFDINNQIFFDGSLSGGDAVLSWLTELDLYIQPSRTEGLPRALIEAMSVGLPAIATNVGGIPELLHQDDLIEKDDYVALAKKILFAINSQQQRYEMGKRNYLKSLDYDSKKLNKIRSEFWEQAAIKIKASY